MDNTEKSIFRELEKPPTLVAESGSEKIRRGSEDSSSRMASGEEKSATMPVLQPNVGIGTRTKSGRIHKPARNFNSDEYVVPTLVKRRIPNNSRPSASTAVKEKPAPAPSPPVPQNSGPGGSVSTGGGADLIQIRSKLEQKFPQVSSSDEDETPFSYIVSVCFKEQERLPNMSVADIHTKVKNAYKTWTKGPFRLREDEIKFVQECIVKSEWSRIPVKDWRILANALKDRMNRVKKRFSRPGPGRSAKKGQEDLKKTFSDLGNKIVKGLQSQSLLASVPDAGDDEVSDEIDRMEEDSSDAVENCSSQSHVSRLSTRSKEVNSSRVVRGESNSKPSSITNDDFEMSLGACSVGIDDDMAIAEEDLKDEMFDDLESALVNESSKSSGNSMVAALHATLQTGGIDSSQYQPPAVEKDGSLFASLDDMEGTENFFEPLEEPNFGDGDAETPRDELTEGFAELEGDVPDTEDVKPFGDENTVGDQSTTSCGKRNVRDHQEKLDLSALEIEESSGNVRPSVSSGEFNSPGPGVTMISTKTALMCALKISEDFLPSTHEKYLDRLEITEKYRHEDISDIRRRFNIRSSTAMLAKQKLNIEQPPIDSNSNKKPKVALKTYNGPGAGITEKPKAGMPYLRSAYARCRKFMEDETTVIEKLGNNKILAGGQVIEIDYENYVKETDVQIPFDDEADQMPKLLPPSVSNCHAPPCRLGCICSSISEDMPPRKHCGRPKCFFECNCQQLLLNSNDDGDIRSRLRPRVSLLNWRAESTEKEKEPMTSYRQMERGAHFFRVRRTAVSSSERLRRDFNNDGKVVERTATTTSVKVTKERFRTKALLQPGHLHRRFIGKHDPHARQFLRILPGKAEQKTKEMETLEQMKKKMAPLTVDLNLLDIEITPVKSESNLQQPLVCKRQLPFMTRKEPSSPKLSAKDIDEMKSIIQEMTEDCQLLALDDRIAFFSWSKTGVNPRVIMYQVQLGDEFKVPWIYLPIPPQGYSWICHYLSSSFENTDYVYIPEIQCSISSHALRVNMNTAFVRKKGVVFDVKATGNAPGIGKIYFFPDLPKILICGPFRTQETTINPHDEGNVSNIQKALSHMGKLRMMKHFGDDQSWKKFTSSPTIFPIKKRNDNETTLSPEESRKLFAQIYPSLISAAPINQVNTVSVPNFQPPAVPAFVGWSNAVKFVGLGGPHKSLTELVSLI